MGEKFNPLTMEGKLREVFGKLLLRLDEVTKVGETRRAVIAKLKEYTGLDEGTLYRVIREDYEEGSVRAEITLMGKEVRKLCSFLYLITLNLVVEDKGSFQRFLERLSEPDDTDEAVRRARALGFEVAYDDVTESLVAYKILEEGDVVVYLIGEVYEKEG